MRKISGGDRLSHRIRRHLLLLLALVLALAAVTSAEVLAAALPAVAAATGEELFEVPAEGPADTADRGYADKWTLPKNDRCYTTLEAYKRYLTPLIDEYWRALQYRSYLKDMEQWQQCCPGSEQTSVRHRPKNPDPPYPEQLSLPLLFTGKTPCGQVIKSRGKEWFEHSVADRSGFWENQFSFINKNLYDCCMSRFNSCLEQVPRQQKGSSGVPADEAYARCVKRFSPDYQEKVVAESSAAQTKQESAPAGQEAERAQLAQADTICDPGLTVFRRERDECQQRLQQQEAAQQAQLAQLTKKFDTTVRDIRELLAAAPVSGFEALAGLLSGSASPALLVCGAIVLAAGFVLGMPGHVRERSKIAAGRRGALFALVTYLLTVICLPETQLPHLFLALTIAVLAVTLRALVRALLLLRRQSGQPPPSP